MDARTPPYPDFLRDGGEAGELIRRYDWAATPIGPISGWPQSLKTTVGLMLRSPIPMVLLWGEHGVMIYNGPYSEFAAGRHPRLLGSNVLEGWPEVAAFNARVMEVGMAGGTLSFRDQELTLYRKGVPEQVWMNLDYSPVIDESGQPGGVLAIVVETTGRMTMEAALRDSETRLRGVLDGMGESLALMDRDFRIIDMNAEALRLEGRPRHEVIGKTHWEAHPDADPALGEMFRQAMETKAPVTMKHRYVWPHGRVSWIDMHAYPVGDGLAVFYGDVTEQVEAEDRLRESEERLRLMADAVPQIIWVTDAEGQTEFFNRQWFEYTGATDKPDSAAQVAADFVHSDDQAVTMQAFEEAIRNQGIFEVEHRIRSKEGEYRWFLVRAEPYCDPRTAEIVRWFGVSIDIHDRRIAQEHQQLLINELNHRVKNTLATVQSVASQTLRNAESAQQAREALEARLFALSRAHDVLTRENWEGADLYDIVEQAVAPYSSRGEDRLHLAGPRVRVPPRMALALAMALQELATNAVKYGALSNETGAIGIAWSVQPGTDGPRLHLQWEESGGPAVRPPSRRGFGSRLIERSLSQDLDGTAQIAFPTTGVVCIVDAPLA
ncbi:PAS domain-containing sensor histidine kinase [Microvirga splendida]|uniref:Blue-light-activated histidine kinase n=1 Tax=Microvirga splendida TaxID=2795727 RepID=A0ABS0XWD6_9HYPH|nr:HWE histidine kinase domain-containing protein [Microvirga splendida]MBJ6124361.1 PAS domain S-box protein [Microvirga splendida]